MSELIENSTFIIVYRWSISEEIPIGIYISDNPYIIITFIGSWGKKYEHNVGLIIQNNPTLQKGIEFLIQ